MAENDRRSYRDPPARQGADEARRDQADDPLAELARLIGQSVPKLGRERRPLVAENVDERRGQIDPTARDAASEVLQEPGDEHFAVADDEPYEPDVDPNYRARSGDHYEQVARAILASPSRASRFRREPDLAMEPSREPADGEGGVAAYQEPADWHEASSAQHDDRYADEYDNEQDGGGDRPDDDEYSEDRTSGRRGGFFFVAAVFALAVLGTAGAFAYRTMFGGPVPSALPPIIKAEAGPNKIIPGGVSSPDAAGRQADTISARSGERLVSREERPVEIPPPVTSTAPRAVATVPVFPDPPPLGGPGAVVGYSGNPTNAAASIEPPSAPATTSTTASPAPSSVQAGPAAGVSTSPPAPPGTAAPGPKKIRTVTIRAEQGGPDAGSPPSAPARPATQSPQGSNGPLSIVPSSTEASAPAPRPRTAPAQPAPLNKPPANETASAAPAAPVATAGGYTVQISSQRSEEEAQSSFRDLQAKYPNQLGGRTPIIRRADLGAKGIYYRAMVGPFGSADQATELCSNLKAAGGSCLVQKN